MTGAGTPSLPRRLRWCIVTTLATALLLASAGWRGQPAAAADAVLSLGAEAGLVRPLGGINIGPLGNGTNPPLVQAYRARGLTLIRTHDYYGPLDLATIFPDRSRDPLSPSSYVFDAPVGHDGRSSDQVFASIVDNGFEPYFRLGDSYNNARAPAPGDVATLTAAAVQVLRHYRDGQWNGFRTAFRYVELWNEPDNRQFWTEPASVYLDFYVAAANAIRQALPDLRVGGPALTPAGCLAPQGQAWTRRFLDHVRATGAPLDFFSWHLYSADPGTYAACATFYRAELDARGFTGVPMHVTEWNTPNAAGERGVDLRARAEGAAINTGAWIAMQQHGIEEALFYRGPDPNPDFPAFYGMFHADGRPKAVGLAAELWHETTRFPLRRHLAGGAEAFAALAGTNTAGGLAVLVANLANRPRTWTLDEGPSWEGTTATVKTVSDDAAAVVTASTAARTFAIPAFGVQLVTIEPRTPAATRCAPSQPAGGGPVTDPQGPYYHRVAVGRLDADGRVGDYRHVLDHASVPDAVRMPDGRLMLYYVNGADGSVWAAGGRDDAPVAIGPIRLNGIARPAGVVDPDASFVNGRVRLAYLANAAGTLTMCLAESADGIDFWTIGEALAVPPGQTWTDPTLVPLGEGRWLMALSHGAQTVLARSSDGFRFTAGDRLAFGGVPEAARLGDGRLALYVCARGIQRYTSTDVGATWRFDTTTLDLPGLLCDPSHVAGTDVFVFKTGY